jgi:hypothetical protein
MGADVLEFCLFVQSLAYIGSDKAIDDLPFLQGNLSAAGLATY